MTSATPEQRAEDARLDALHRYDILDQPPDKVFQEIVQMASTICKTPLAYISLVDRDRVWFLAHHGTKLDSVPVSASFCGEAILSPGHVTIVPDIRADARYAHKPLATGEPFFRFYAAAPLITSDGFALGTVCVLDKQTRELDAAQIAGLQSLAKMVINMMEWWRATHTTNAARLKDQQQKMAYVAATTAASLDLLSFIDRDYVYRYVNTTYARYWGVSADVIIGMRVPELIGTAVFESKIKGLLDKAFAGKDVHFETAVEFAALGQRHVEVNFTPVRDASGDVIGVTGRLHDINAINERRVALRSTNLKLEEQNIFQQRLIKILSHDLREPLNTIINFSGLLETEHAHALPDKGKRFLDNVRAGGTRLQALLDDLVDYVNLDASQIVRAPIALDNLVNVVSAEMAESISTSGADIQSLNLPTILGAPALVHQLFQHLISNSLKFSRRGVAPVIRLHSEPDAGGILISISDNGLGIPTDQRERVFDLFYRIHSRSFQAGHGVGLALIRKIAELHGWRIWISDVQPIGVRVNIGIPLHDVIQSKVVA